LEGNCGESRNGKLISAVRLNRKQERRSHQNLAVLLFSQFLCLSLLFYLDKLHAADYFSPDSVRFKVNGFFRVATIEGREHLVTPDGRAYVAVSVNHLSSAIPQDKPGSADWESFWE